MAKDSSFIERRCRWWVGLPRRGPNSAMRRRAKPRFGQIRVLEPIAFLYPEKEEFMADPMYQGWQLMLTEDESISVPKGGQHE